MLKRVVPFTSSRFGRALIMPNLNPPVKNVEQALKYRAEILNAVPSGTTFDPKMSLYLTDSTAISDVVSASQSDHISGFKLYPAGATTHSDSGVTKITGVMPVLEAMAEHGVVLQVHGEVTDKHVDIFDREAVFIDQILSPLNREIPQLKIVLEHITTREGVSFVESAGQQIAGTITPQHLLYNRNEIFRGGIRPHAFCLPVLKREVHRQALMAAATQGNESFFLGTDSAPHTRGAKQSECGCAGIFCASAAIEIYAEIFASIDKLHMLEGFASHHGADYYGVKRNTETITLINQDHTIPAKIGCENDHSDNDLIPLMAGQQLSWMLKL
jgi:dihydroorotase